MYHGAGDPRSARRSRDLPAGFSPEVTARTVLSRLRKLLDAYTPGMVIERTRVPESLAVPLADAALERQRLFALGWLHWLNDDLAAAEPLLADALRRSREQNAGEALAEAAYWSTRVRLLLGRSEAMAEYESVLRSLSGSPRAAAWLVDLLGRPDASIAPNRCGSRCGAIAESSAVPRGRCSKHACCCVAVS